MILTLQRDDAVYNASQTEAVITIGTTVGTRRAGVMIGPAYFSSYGTFPHTSYIAGLNLATNGSSGSATRQAEVKAISKILGNSLEFFEIGNEPDLFQLWNRRAASWGVTDYVAEWEAAAKLIQSTLPKSSLSYFAPSFAGTDTSGAVNSMGPVQAFANGLSTEKSIKMLSGHKYVYAYSPISDPQTYMSHTVTWAAPPDLASPCKPH
jgi:hypothetical protein